LHPPHTMASCASARSCFTLGAKRLSHRRLWNASTGQCIKTLVDQANPPVSNLRFSPNGRFLLACTLDSVIRLWSVLDEKILKEFAGHTNAKCAFASFAVVSESPPQILHHCHVSHAGQRQAGTGLHPVWVRGRQGLHLGHPVDGAPAELAGSRRYHHRCVTRQIWRDALMSGQAWTAARMEPPWRPPAWTR
jgi:hypothetical protein